MRGSVPWYAAPVVRSVGKKNGKSTLFAATIAWSSPCWRASSSPAMSDGSFSLRFARSRDASMSACVGSVSSRGWADAFAFMNSWTDSRSIDSDASRLMWSGASTTRKRTSRTGLETVKRTVFANLKISFVESSDLSRSK